MGYYDLTADERRKLDEQIYQSVEKYLRSEAQAKALDYFADPDTYVRKSAYRAVGQIYGDSKLKPAQVKASLEALYDNPNELIRQSAVYGFGEIGKHDPAPLFKFLPTALSDESSRVRNAVVGCLKNIGKAHPKETLAFIGTLIGNDDPEQRRIAIHGAELHGRTNPQAVLPLLKRLQFEENKRVIKTIIHVIGQISYKKGNLKKVLNDLKTWENKELVVRGLKEIYAVHVYYSDFAAHTSEQAKEMIISEFSKIIPRHIPQLVDMYITPGKKVAGRKKPRRKS